MIVSKGQQREPLTPFCDMPLTKRLRPNNRSQHGFALVIALTLMAFILLLLLSLSTLLRVETEVSETHRHTLEAQQNALLALNVAAGELQKNLGADQRISVTAEILEGNTNELSLGTGIENPHLVGVWRTSQWALGAPIDYTGQKQNQFVRWLMSYPDDSRSDLEQMDLPQAALVPESILLVGEGAVGATLANDNTETIRAPLVTIGDLREDQFAWTVLDEGVKASIALPTSHISDYWGSTDAQAIASYGLPTGNGVGRLSDLTAFTSIFQSNRQGRLLSNDTGLLGFLDEGGVAEDLQAYFHDLTPLSYGVLSDPVYGGLKMDLSLLSEYSDLGQSDFQPRYLYSSSATASYLSEPSWEQILSFLSSYRSSRLSLDGDDIPRIDSSVVGWTEDSNEMLPPRTSYEPTPAIARIQLVFSLVALRAPSNRLSDIQLYSGNTYNSSNSYMLYMIVSPVVTLYNPYNVPIKTESLYLSLGGIPVGFTFKRADHSDMARLVALTDRAVPLDAMLTNPNNVARLDTHGVEYIMSISAKDDASDDFVLAPGETVVISPFADDSNTALGDLSNWQANKQSDSNIMQGQQGYIEGAGLVYDYLNPSRGNPRANYDYSNESDKLTLIDGSTTLPNASPNLGLQSFDGIIVKDNDEIEVDVDFVKPHHPEGVEEKPFAIRLYDRHPFSGDESEVQVLGSYRFEYDDIDTLRTAAEQFSNLSFPLNTPLIPGSNLTLTGNSLSGATVGLLAPTPIAALDVFSQTTLANNNPSMPWAFSNPTTLAGVNRLDVFSTFNHSYQVTLRSIAIPTVEIDSENHGFSFTGVTSLEGIKFGTHFEQPMYPVQSLATLQHANLASSSYLPKVDYVVGNSFANPLLATGSAISYSADLGYDLIDHSYLSNYVLWDRYYLSTLATYESAFDSNGPDLESVVDAFLNGEALMNPNLVRSQSSDTVSAIRSELIAASGQPISDAYRKAAAYQYVQGAFNVNSTSISAWKALLSGVAEQAVNAPPRIQEVSDSDYDLSYNTAQQYTFSRYRLSNHDAAFDQDAANTSSTTTRSSPAAHAAWQGYRDLTDAQLDELAENIVDEVKRRGPFLSLAEFINHRLGTNSGDSRNLMGAIDAAIAQTDINDQVESDMGLSVDIGSMGLPNQSYQTESSAKGIPAFFTQADLLQQIGPKLSARSDTFRIRAYGDSRHPISGEKYRAYCEAIIQRTPEYVETNLEPWDDPSLSDWGRRFKIISLRWLTEDEI